MTNKPTKNNTSSNRKNDINESKKVVESSELDQIEELSIRIDTLVELLTEKGIINKKVYVNNVMMRIHETSKAKSFDECDEI